MEEQSLMPKVCQIAKQHHAIMQGKLQICGDVHCFVFAHFCKSTLFYKDFLGVSRDILRANRLIMANLDDVRRLVRQSGAREIWTKGAFCVYGDLRPLAVQAGFGQWGEDGLIVNSNYGSNFLISALFYR